MTEVVHADIFFLITAIAVIFVGAAMMVALVYLIVILRDVRAVAKKIRKASDEIEQDFEDVRAQFKNEGMRLRTIVELILSFVGRHVPARRKKGKETTSEET